MRVYELIEALSKLDPMTEVLTSDTYEYVPLTSLYFDEQLNAYLTGVY